MGLDVQLDSIYSSFLLQASTQAKYLSRIEIKNRLSDMKFPYYAINIII